MDRGPSETQRIAQALIDRTLPKAEWTHHAHLRAGLWHVVQHGAPQALALMRARIRHYNESVGTPNTDSSGYHETLTCLYVHLIAAFVGRADRALPIDVLSTQLLAELGARELPLQHFSPERLWSVQARRVWLEPDRMPLPGVTGAP